MDTATVYYFCFTFDDKANQNKLIYRESVYYVSPLIHS